MEQQIIIIGTATIDLIFQGSVFSSRRQNNRLALAYGGKYVVDNLFQCFGGGGANCAVSLCRQGLKASLWAKIATDYFGGEIQKNLSINKVNLNLTQADMPKSSVSAILLDTKGDRTIVNYRSTGDNLDFNDKIKQAISQYSWLALFSMPRWPKQKKVEVLEFARKKGLKIFLSLHADEYRKGISWVKDYFRYTQILDLNIFELAALLKTKAENIDLKKDNFSIKLGVPQVLVTHDKRGSYYYSPKEIYFEPPSEVKMVDATGAGDAFCAGFLGKFIKTDDYRLAMNFGRKNAEAEIQVLGAQTGLLADK